MFRPILETSMIVEAQKIIFFNLKIPQFTQTPLPAGADKGKPTSSKICQNLNFDILKKIIFCASTIIEVSKMYRNINFTCSGTSLA